MKVLVIPCEWEEKHEGKPFIEKVGKDIPLEFLDKYIKTYPEFVRLKGGYTLICDDSGLLLGLPANKYIYGFVGDLIIFKDDYSDMTHDDCVNAVHYAREYGEIILNNKIDWNYIAEEESLDEDDSEPEGV